MQMLKNKTFRRGLLVFYLLAITIIFIKVRAIWTPDIIFLALLGLFVVLGEGKQFFLHFSPFVILLLSYEKLRSLAPLINKTVHYSEMIRFDLWLFNGTLPTVWLQRYLYNGQLSWYDFVLYFFYMMHFIVPLLLGVIIWRTKPKYYWQFVVGLLLLSYAGFITYIIFPAAPPWLASELGMLQPSTAHISSDIWRAFGVQDVSGFYKKLSPNLVAAVPSLHSAYPLLFALFIRKIWGNKWFALSMIYPLIIWFGVVYLGEHYVFDVLVAIIYAYLCFRVAPRVSVLIAKLLKALENNTLIEKLFKRKKA